MQICNVEQQRWWQGHQVSSLLPNIAREKTQASIEIFNVVRKIIANNGEKEKQLDSSVFFVVVVWTKFMENGKKPCMLPKYFLKNKVKNEKWFFLKTPGKKRMQEKAIASEMLSSLVGNGTLAVVKNLLACDSLFLTWPSTIVVGLWLNSLM